MPMLPNGQRRHLDRARQYGEAARFGHHLPNRARHRHDQVRGQDDGREAEEIRKLHYDAPFDAGQPERPVENSVAGPGHDPHTALTTIGPEG